MRRWVGIISVVLMGLVGSSFAGTYGGGTGEPDDPYQIETPEQLLSIGSNAELLNKCYILNNDIDLDTSVTGLPYFSQAPIAPDTSSTSGFQGSPFTGVFDGNGHTILELTIIDTETANDYLALFGKLGEGGTIKNLGIWEGYIVGFDSDYLGGICGYNAAGTIRNCLYDGDVTGDDYLGGLCGSNYFGIIENCFTTGAYNGDDWLGGLCGYNESGTITNCYVEGSVTGFFSLWYIGGLCGSNYQGTITNCFVNASVSAGPSSTAIGGFCGGNYESNVSGCFAIGSVTAQNDSRYIGGLFAYNDEDSSITNCFSNVDITCGASQYIGGICGSNFKTISNCYSAGYITDYNQALSHFGELCGYNHTEGTFSNCYYLDTDVPNNPYGIPLTDTQMKQQTSFINWDFVIETANGTDEIWTIKEGVKYPEFVWPLVQYQGWDGVDFLDFSFFANHWFENNCGNANDCEGADLDFSDKVDEADLMIFCDHWLEGKDY